jgi:hypothetical protein
VNVDIEIDLADAGLFGPMRTAFMPAAIAGAGVPDIGKPQAAPLRQLAAAAAGELPGQHNLFAGPVGADDVRTEFAGAAAIAADHLLLGEDGVAEEGVAGARHCGAVADKLRFFCYPAIDVASRERRAHERIEINPDIIDGKHSGGTGSALTRRAS